MRKRQKELQERLEELNRSREEYEAMAAAAKRLLDFEYLQEPSENYLELFQDMEEKKKKKPSCESWKKGWKNSVREAWISSVSSVRKSWKSKRSWTVISTA